MSTNNFEQTLAKIFGETESEPGGVDKKDSGDEAIALLLAALLAATAEETEPPKKPKKPLPLGAELDKMFQDLYEDAFQKFCSDLGSEDAAPEGKYTYTIYYQGKHLFRTTLAFAWCDGWTQAMGSDWTFDDYVPEEDHNLLVMSY